MMKTARIVIACLLLCFASLAFLPAPHVFVWQLKLVATELGHWMVIAPLSVIAGSRLRSRLDIITTVIAVLAAALFLSSSVRAACYASTAATIIDAAPFLQTGMAALFPFGVFGASERPPPLASRRLILL